MIKPGKKKRTQKRNAKNAAKRAVVERSIIRKTLRGEQAERNRETLLFRKRKWTAQSILARWV